MLLKGEAHTDGEHPTDDVIAGYLDARLHSDERRTVEAHLATCEPCRMLVAECLRLLETPNATKPATTDADGDKPEPY